MHRLTAPALADLVEKPEKPTPVDLRMAWIVALPVGERAIFSAIYKIGREAPVDVGALMLATSYRETSVRTYLKALKSRGLIQSSKTLFDLVPELLSG